jgi:DtxR family Mn-dependent transcriptional regulator
MVLMPGRTKEEYLSAIYSLREDGREAKTGEIAKALEVKDSSVSEMLRKLHEDGYIKHKPYHGVELTRKGLKAAAKVKRKHRLLERFLYDVLKIRKSRVHEQACQMEHTLSDEAAEALDKLMEHPETCPDDRRPIPPAEHVKTPDTLVHMKVGETAKVTQLDGGVRFQSRMMTLGIKKGKKIKLVAKEPLGGPVVVKTGNTKVTVGRGMASKVRVAKE